MLLVSATLSIAIIKTTVTGKLSISIIILVYDVLIFRMISIIQIPGLLGAVTREVQIIKVALYIHNTLM